MLQFDVIDETLSLTNLKQIKKGTKVNLERSMTVKLKLVATYYQVISIVREQYQK